MKNIEIDKLFADFEKRSICEMHGNIVYADWDGMHSVKYRDSWDWILPVWQKASNEIIGSDYVKIKAKICMAICDVNIENACTYLYELITSHLKMQK